MPHFTGLPFYCTYGRSSSSLFEEAAGRRRHPNLEMAAVPETGKNQILVHPIRRERNIFRLSRGPATLLTDYLLLSFSLGSGVGDNGVQIWKWRRNQEWLTSDSDGNDLTRNKPALAANLVFLPTYSPSAI